MTKRVRSPWVAEESPISASEVARRFLGRSPGWFTAHRDDLEKKGFPQPIAVSGRYRVDQVQAWLDGRPLADPKSGLTLEARVNEWGKSA